MVSSFHDDSLFLLLCLFFRCAVLIALLHCYHTKKKKVHVDPVARDSRSRLVPRHAGPVEIRTTMGHTAVLGARSSVCALECSTVPTRTLPTVGRRSQLTQADTTRLSEHIMRVTDVLCSSTVTVHGLVLEWLDTEGLDVRPSHRWVSVASA